MASARQIAANRRNAKRSTGPRTKKGKARSRLNALKHSFTRRLPPEDAYEPAVHPLAQVLVGEGTTDPAVLSHADRIARESLELRRVRAAKAALLSGKGALHDPDLIRDLPRLERYERQALARRSRALHELDAATPKLTRAAGNKDIQRKEVRENGVSTRGAGVTDDGVHRNDKTNPI